MNFNKLPNSRNIVVEAKIRFYFFLPFILRFTSILTCIYSGVMALTDSFQNIPILGLSVYLIYKYVFRIAVCDF